LLADGSGIIHVGSNFSIVLMLGTIEDFKPEGTRIIKLCAKFLLSGSFSAKYKSK